MKKLSVGVVFGGRSVEHDVSIVSAHQIMAVLSDRHQVVPIYVTRAGRWLSSPGLNDLEVYRTGRATEVGEDAFIPPSSDVGGLLVGGGRLRKPRFVPLDVVVPAIHGTFGEDGTLQGLLELADLPYTCSGVVGSALGLDKVAMKAAFAAADLPITPHVLVDAERLDVAPQTAVDDVERSLHYPVFVKPARLGSSVGIGRAADRDGLLGALDVARRYDRRILVETSMEDCIEVNCSVLGGPGHAPRASVCEQPVAWEQFLTFSDKYLRGGKASTGESAGGEGSKGMAGQQRLIPAPVGEALTKQIQENAIRAFNAVDASGVARIDAFVREKNEETWVMEINTIPGSFAFYLWEPSGVSFGELVEELIEIALSAHRKKSELMFSFDSDLLEGARGEKLRD